mgnify:CR=1 FL=1
MAGAAMTGRLKVTDDYVAIFELRNNDIEGAIKEGRRIAKDKFYGLPLEFSVIEWDESYGDILADGLVLFRIKRGLYNEGTRIQREIKRRQIKSQ